MSMSVSRYTNVAKAVWTAPDGSQVPYLLQRLLPMPGTMATAGRYQVQQWDRIDTIANATLGDPTLSWQLADANLGPGPTRPTQLAQPGRALVIPPPGGISGGSGGQ
jgi:hypothetical protein